MLKAGFASADITPPVGKEIPGLFERRIALGIHDPLYARAAFLDDGKQTVAFVQVDAIVVGDDLVRRARQEAQRLCGIPARDCFITATHTHSGGPLFEGLCSAKDEDYAAWVAAQIGSAVAEAQRRCAPALSGTSEASVPGVAFNRRFLMQSGREITHPGKLNPRIVSVAGPEDPTVTVVGFCNPDSLQPFGCLVHFACHATHMNGLLFSADYVGWVVGQLQAAYGPEFGVVYLNGAAGDITQVDNQSGRPSEFGPYWCERTGRAIAGGALQALACTDYEAETVLDVGASKTTIPIRRSSPEKLKAARKRAAQGKPSPDDVESFYAHELLLIEAMRKAQPACRIEIMGVRINRTFLWGVPGELFQAFAAEVQAGSPFAHTRCIGLANGYHGYICTESAFGGGGYEIRTARSSHLDPKAGARIVQTAVRLRERMCKQALECQGGRAPTKVWPESEDSALDGIKQLRE